MNGFRRLAAMTALLALAGCIGGGERTPPRAGRDTPRLPGIESAVIQQCLTDLQALNVAYQPLDDRLFDGGCSASGSVQLTDIGVPVANLGAIRCPMARTFAQWVTHGVRPAARVYLGAELARIESFGSYSCRRVAGTARLSEHASANAVDVAAFVLDDGRRISVKSDWRSDDPQVREFLRTIFRSACRRFGTVLGPDYNLAHADHLHLDLGPGPYCR